MALFLSLLRQSVRIQLCIQIPYGNKCSSVVSVLQLGVVRFYRFDKVHSDSGVITTNPRIRFPRTSSNL